MMLCAIPPQMLTNYLPCRARALAAMSCLADPEPAPALASLLWIAAGVGGTCLVLQAALTLLFAKLLPSGPWTSQPAFAACAPPANADSSASQPPPKRPR